VWIGGVALVATAVFPAIRHGVATRDRLALFEAIERRFVWCRYSGGDKWPISYRETPSLATLPHARLLVDARDGFPLGAVRSGTVCWRASGSASLDSEKVNGGFRSSFLAPMRAHF
jgi:hypothetical protein